MGWVKGVRDLGVLVGGNLAEIKTVELSMEWWGRLYNSVIDKGIVGQEITKNITYLTIVTISRSSKNFYEKYSW